MYRQAQRRSRSLRTLYRTSYADPQVSSAYIDVSFHHHFRTHSIGVYPYDGHVWCLRGEGELLTSQTPILHEGSSNTSRSRKRVLPANTRHLWILIRIRNKDKTHSRVYPCSSTNIVHRIIYNVNTRRRNSRRANCAAWNSLPDGTCVYADFARVRRSCRDYWPFKKHRPHCRLAAEIAATLITSRSTRSRSVRKTSSDVESPRRIWDNTCLLCLHGVSSRLN